MDKTAVLLFVLAFLAMFIMNSVNPALTDVLAASTETEVDTSVFIVVNPDKPEAAQAVNVKIWIEPAPPSPSDQFTGLALTIKRPDGVTNEYTAIGRADDGTYYWSYMINQLGNYTFQCSYPGNSFANGAIKYKPSLSPIVTITAIGDAKPPVEVQGGSWIQKESMSQARAALGVAVANGKIYAIGGSDKNGTYLPKYSGGFVDTNEEYNPATNIWTAKKPMPTPRFDFAIAVCQNKIYCLGGVVGFRLDDFYHLFHVSVASDVNEVYNPATDTWETKASMPAAASALQANVVDDKIFVFNGKALNVYDPASDSWTAKASPPTGVDGYVSAAVDNKIYVISNYSPVLIYDTETDSWSQGARSPRLDVIGPAEATTGALAPKRIYIFAVAPYGWVPYGESDTSGYSRKTTFVYNPETDSWSAGTIIPTYRLNFGIAAANDILYVIGGYTFDVTNSNSNATVSAITEQYTPIGYGTILPSPSSTISPSPPITTAPTPTSSSEPFPATWIIASGASIIAVGAGLLVYFKKRNHAKMTDKPK